jgi:rhodanese-related sulfurtransferase
MTRCRLVEVAKPHDMGKTRSMLSRFLKKFMVTSSMLGIAHEDLVQAHKSGTCTVVDVREPNEYAGGHIPGAVNVPLSQFDPDRVPHGKPVVLICQAGGRSASAMKRMIAAGRQDAQHYAPGMSGWRARKGPVER